MAEQTADSRRPEILRDGDSCPFNEGWCPAMREGDMQMNDQGNTMLWGRGSEAAWSDSLRLWTAGGRWWAGAGAV